MSVTLRSNQIIVSTEGEINYTPMLLFCTFFSTLAILLPAEAAIRGMKGGNRNENEDVVNVLVLSICM